MKIYTVIDIKEQDFGCEGRPSDMPYCVDVILHNYDSDETITLSSPDAELYKKNIDIGSKVSYDGRALNLIK